MNVKNICVLLAILLMTACKQKSVDKLSDIENREIENEDSIELKMIRLMQDKIKNSVSADVETTPVSARSLEDAADDPAVWYNADTPSQSVVYGSNKRGGIVAYDLEGNELKYYPIGNVNNIDVLDSFSSSTEKTQLLGCTNRSTQSIDLFFIQEDGSLLPARKSQMKVNPSEIDDVYGFCFGKDIQHGIDYLFINGKNGRMEQYAIQLEGDTIGLQRTRIVQFDDQTEGMVVDEATGTLYVGAENTGIWKLSIHANSVDDKQLISSSTIVNESIKFDIEGLSLMTYANKTYLLASSQGNFSYAIFDLSDNDSYLKSFKVVNSKTIDGVEETDGIDIMMDSLSPRFPKGIFIAQDGYNFDNDTLVPQNFKLVGLEKIHSFLDDL